MSESSLQVKVNEYLTKCGIIFRHRAKGRGGRMQKYMQNDGWPDLAIYPGAGEVFFIELKTDSGKLEDNQVKTRDRLMMKGYSYHVCRTFEEVADVIESEMEL